MQLPGGSNTQLMNYYYYYSFVLLFVYVLFVYFVVYFIIIIIIIIIIIFALVFHSQCLKIGKCKNVCPEWLRWGLLSLLLTIEEKTVRTLPESFKRRTSTLSRCHPAPMPFPS